VDTTHADEDVKRRFLVTSALFDHPALTPLHRRVGLENEKGVFSEFEAFIWLQTQPFTIATIPGASYAPMTLSLAEEAEGSIPNVTSVWKWSPPRARMWLNELSFASLITEQLETALRRRTLKSAWHKRRRSILPGDRQTVLAKTSGKCVYCAVILTAERGQPNTFHADHVLPVALGGGDDIANLVPACATCNGKKKAMTALQFMGEANG
jgi:5-methylcytosine-specific restriction endonuclease McrA